MNESEIHAALSELFRDFPGLAAELAAEFGGVALPDGYTARTDDPTIKLLNRIVDAVSLVQDAEGVNRAAIEVEIQMRVEEDKLETWPTCMWAGRARWKCDSHMLVISPRENVVAWASQPIVNGDSVTRVIPVGPGRVPRITDPEQARASPGLALLSSAMYARRPEGQAVVAAAVAALRSLPRAVAQKYISLALHTRDPDEIRRIFEDTMQAHQEQPEEPLYNGWKEFLREEAVKEQARILIRQLERRGFADPASRERVLACTDGAQLDTWLDRVLVATSAAEVFAP